jgi:hypothetical protein
MVMDHIIVILMDPNQNLVFALLVIALLETLALL